MSYGSALVHNEYKDILADSRYDCPEPKSSILRNITEKCLLSTWNYFIPLLARLHTNVTSSSSVVRWK
jgi:hypothetical protein